MKRTTLINLLLEVCKAKLNDDEKQRLTDFIKTNQNKKDDFEFYETLKTEFPWIELLISYTKTSSLIKIENYLYFFKVLTIIGLVIAFIFALNTLS